MSVRRGGPGLRETPTVRELLGRASWDDLSRIATHHSVHFAGRRRVLAVDRLALLLERPEQLRAAYRILPEPTRAVLSLLMLLGSADDERAMAAARDRLLAVRPDVEPLLGRAHLANELQTLTALGLCYRERRRLVVPIEVLETLPLAFTPALPPVAQGALDLPEPVAYAALRYTIDRLVDALAQSAPAALPPHRPSERAAIYHTLLLSPDRAAELGTQLGLAPADLVWLLALLETLGVVAAARGHWQVQPGWRTLQEEAPRVFLNALLNAWHQPRALSDVMRTGSFVWQCAPEADAADLVPPHEASLRALVWRCLGWCGPGPVDVVQLCAVLAALHGARLLPEEEVWIAPAQAGRGAARTVTPEALMLALMPQLLQQLAQLGLVVADARSCALTPLTDWLLHLAAIPASAPPIQSAGLTTLLVQPLAAEPEVLRLIGIVGQMQSPQDTYARYELGPQGVARLLARGHTIGAFEAALLSAGAQLSPTLRAQLTSWSERAGRVRMHRPLTMIVAADDTPLAQVLLAAGLANAAEILGPGCALIEPEYAEQALEQLRARGYWPHEIRTES